MTFTYTFTTHIHWGPSHWPQIPSGELDWVGRSPASLGGQVGGGPGTIHLWPGECGDWEHSSRSKRFAAVQQAGAELGPAGTRWDENGRECWYFVALWIEGGTNFYGHKNHHFGGYLMIFIGFWDADQLCWWKNGGSAAKGTLWTGSKFETSPPICPSVPQGTMLSEAQRLGLELSSGGSHPVIQSWWPWRLYDLVLKQLWWLGDPNHFKKPPSWLV
jgi:hypothetical protein